MKVFRDGDGNIISEPIGLWVFIFLLGFFAILAFGAIIGFAIAMAVLSR